MTEVSPRISPHLTASHRISSLEGRMRLEAEDRQPVGGAHVPGVSLACACLDGPTRNTPAVHTQHTSTRTDHAAYDWPRGRRLRHGGTPPVGSATEVRLVELGALSSREQLSLVRGAAGLIGAHGAALVRSLFPDLSRTSPGPFVERFFRRGAGLEPLPPHGRAPVLGRCGGDSGRFGEIWGDLHLGAPVLELLNRANANAYYSNQCRWQRRG